MNASASAAPLTSFEAKWSEAHPELAIALTFTDSGERAARSAFACLGFEIEHAAFAIRDAEPAAAKLRWWAEELVRSADGHARHPLTHALAEGVGADRIRRADWPAVIVGAIAQRDAEPPADTASLLAGHARFYRPLADAGAILFGDRDAVAAAAAAALSRAARDTAALADVLRDGRMPLPLDLLARHRLARGDLARDTRERAQLLRDWLAALADEGTAIARGTPRFALTATATLATTRAQLRRSARAKDPLAALADTGQRLPFSATWAVWRAARRSRA